MSKFTIENLLAEKRAGDAPDLFTVKEASFSAQPPVSRPLTSDEEIEKMANLLRNADVTKSEDSSFNERIAAALILSDAINSIIKEASDFSESLEGDSKKDPKEEDEEEEEEKKAGLTDEEEKIASFVKSAKAQGYSDQEVSDFLEKQAKMKVKPETLRKVLGLSAGAAGVGYAGHEVGKKKGKKEVAEKASKVIPAFYRAGVLKGYRAGLARASAEGK